MEPVKSGIILLDKPAGITSHQAVVKVKKRLNADKTGHSGTLDTNTTGVLVVGVNEAVKIMPVLVGLDKEYQATMHLHMDVDKEKLTSVLRQFVGDITQKPPVRSRVSRKPRQRHVYFIKLQKLKERNADLLVKCQSGTYVRKLVHDVGEKIGGAHMAKLRRKWVGPFSESECVSLEDLERNEWRHIIRIEKTIERINSKKIIVKEASLARILNGSPVMEEDVEFMDSGIQTGEKIGIFFRKKFIGLGICDGEKYVAKTDRIIKQ